MRWYDYKAKRSNINSNKKVTYRYVFKLLNSLSENVQMAIFSLEVARMILSSTLLVPVQVLALKPNPKYSGDVLVMWYQYIMCTTSTKCKERACKLKWTYQLGQRIDLSCGETAGSRILNTHAYGWTIILVLTSMSANNMHRFCNPFLQNNMSCSYEV